MARVAVAPPASRWSAMAWWALRTSGVIFLLALWQGLAASGIVTAFMLPPLTAVGERIARDAGSGELFVNLGYTLARALAGFGLAAVLGVGLGLAVTSSRWARWLFDPLISVGFPMPKIAFLPIIVLWFGFHDVSKVSMIVFDAVFPVLTATIAGLGGVERQLLWSARSLGAGKRELMHEIVVPAALPAILTGLQVALPIAIIVCIIAEMTTGGVGLGSAMVRAARFADSRGVFAGIVEIALAGYALGAAMAAVRRHLLVWQT